MSSTVPIIDTDELMQVSKERVIDLAYRSGLNPPAPVWVAYLTVTCMARIGSPVEACCFCYGQGMRSAFKFAKQSVIDALSPHVDKSNCLIQLSSIQHIDVTTIEQIENHHAAVPAKRYAY